MDNNWPLISPWGLVDEIILKYNKSSTNASSSLLVN